MEFMCAAVFVLALLASAAVGAWVIVAAVFRAFSGAEPPSRSPVRRIRYDDCPACDAPLHPDDRDCPECGVPLRGSLATRLNRVRTAEREIEALRERGELDAETAARVYAGLASRRIALLEVEQTDPSRPPVPDAPPVRSPLPVARAVARSDALPGPIVRPPDPDPVPRAEVPAAVEPRRATWGTVLAEFMHTRNILWGELAGGVLIVGCSVALVLSLWRNLESLPYFPFLLSSAITAALFGAGQYTLHHWRLTASSRGLLIIALLLAPLNLLLLTDPGKNGVVGWVDMGVKLAAVLLFTAGVRTAARDIFADALPMPHGVRWLLALAVVGAPATRLLPWDATPLAMFWGWLPTVCFLTATGAVRMRIGRRQLPSDSVPMGERMASAALLFVGVTAFALLASWGAGLVRAEDLTEAMRGLALPGLLAATPIVAVGLIVHRRLTEPIGLRVVGTAVALAGAVVMVSAWVPAWPDPVTVLIVAAVAGATLSGFAFRDRLVWVHLAALPSLAMAFLLGVNGVRAGWVAPPDVNAGLWLAGQLTSAESGTVLAMFAAVLVGFAGLLTHRACSADARSYAMGSVAAVVGSLFLVSVRGVESPGVAAGTHILGAAVLLGANVLWRCRTLSEASVWLLLPATLWLLWADRPAAHDEWGLAIATESLTLAAVAWGIRWWRGGGGLVAQLQGACTNVAGAAAVLAVAIGLTWEGMPHSPAHTGTLFVVSVTAIVLADVLAARWAAWIASAALLAGLSLLTIVTLDIRPLRLAVMTTLVGHAVVTLGGAIAFRHRGTRDQVLAEPFRWSGLLTSCLAVPLLGLPDPGNAWVWAGQAGVLGLVGLTRATLWRERGAFPAFQVAVFTAAAYSALAWVATTPWVRTSSLGYMDPRALQAYGIAVGLTGLAWVLARRLIGRAEAVQWMWAAIRPSADRVIVGAVVVVQLLIAVAGVFPAVVAELTPIGSSIGVTPPTELGYSWGLGAWVLLGVLAGVMAAEMRVPIRYERRGEGPIIGLMVLAMTVPVLTAGAFTSDIAVASAMRWGFALVFALGAAVVIVRGVLRQAARSVGVWVRGRYAVPVGYGLLAMIACVVVVLTMVVAQLGLTGQTPSGPIAGTVFARMGEMASNLIPLVLLVVGFAGLAFRDRIPVAAFVGGVIFAATLAGGYALTVSTGGGRFDDVESVRLVLLGATGAAVWGLLWLSVEWRVPGRGLLVVMTTTALVGVALLAVPPLTRMLLEPGVPLGPASAELGLFGWTPLILAAVACFWHAHGAAPRLRITVLGWAGVVLGILAGCAVQRWDAPGAWVSYHALAIGWAVAGMALTAFLVGPGVLIGRAWDASVWPGVFASGLLALALRGGWDDPGRPWAPASMALFGSLLVGTIAVQFGGRIRLVYAMVLFDLAAVLVWVAVGPPTHAGFALSVAAGLGLAVGAWSFVTRAFHRITAEGMSVACIAAWVGLAAVIYGLLPTLAGERAEPFRLAWGALAAIGLGLSAQVWVSDDRSTTAGLYLLGVCGVLLAVVGVHTGPVWELWPTPLALAGFSVGAAGVAMVVDTRNEGSERHATRQGRWFGLAQAVVVVAVATLAVSVALREPGIARRMVGPISVALLVLAAVGTMRHASASWVPAIRVGAIGLGTGAVALIGWAAPDPANPVAWLPRNAWLFVGLAASAVITAEVLPRLLPSPWVCAARRAGGGAVVVAVVVLLVHQAHQVLVFDSITRRTPLDPTTVVAGVLGLASLTILTLRFALISDRDPFELPISRRALYVYLAEMLVVLMFVQLRLNCPELFHAAAARYWTFVVMVLAFFVAGAAEMFDRRGLAVLATPLRRTGVLLPLLPLLAFWLRPSGAVLAFAEDQAPGLRPVLGYLERLPQHFDTYAVLWLLAGMLYGLLAALRKSFGWALIAALAVNAGMWAMLAHHEVPAAVHPQAWVIPLALIVLVSEHVHRAHLRRETSVGLRYLSVAMIYGASAADMFIAGVGRSVWLPVVLAALCLAGVLLGVLLRVRAFLFLGVSFLLLDVFAMVWHAAVDREQTWVWYVSGIVLGAAILTLFAVIEKRRNEILEVVARVRRWD